MPAALDRCIFLIWNILDRHSLPLIPQARYAPKIQTPGKSVSYDETLQSCSQGSHVVISTRNRLKINMEERKQEKKYNRTKRKKTKYKVKNSLHCRSLKCSNIVRLFL